MIECAVPARAPPAGSYPAEVDWAAPLPELALHELFAESVARFADRSCLDFLGRRYSYAEIGELVARAARGLQKLGVGKGTRVGLCLPNTPYYVVCYYAVLRCGGIVVNLNPLYALEEMRHLVRDSGIATLVTLDLEQLYPTAERMLGEGELQRLIVCPMAGILPTVKSWLFRLLKRGAVVHWRADERHVPFARLIGEAGAPEPVAVEPHEDLAVLQYTGGTTGVPKGAMLSHRNLVANALQCRRWFHDAVPGGERILAVLPFFHVFAMTTALNLGIAAGAEIILLPRFDLVLLLATIARRKPTILPGVPTLFTALNQHGQLGRYDLSSLRCCISGGAPLPAEVKSAFETLTQCTLVEGYGLSETSPVVACNPFGRVNKPGSVGLPLPQTAIDILSLEDAHRLLGPGEHGEIAIRGPQVMQGYWRKPDATADVIVDGRLRTGDIGYLDEDGYLFIVDRLKDVIIASGYKIFPRNIEEAIYRHPAVAECAVVGIPDEYRGQTVKAYIVRRADKALDATMLHEFLADKLSPMEMPKAVEFRQSLPKTTIGKIAKKELLAEAAEARRAVEAALRQKAESA